MSIDRDAAAPPYEQVVAQIREGCERGDLAPGDRVPTVRALARTLGLVPNTVAKAYRELEAAGYLEGRGRAGTFVRSAPSTLEAEARAYLERARSLGVDASGALEAVRRAARR